MAITATNNEANCIGNLFKLPEPFKKKFSETAATVTNFVKNHKATIFFGAALTVALLAHPPSLACLSVAPLVVSGMLTAFVLQALATFYGANGIGNKNANDAYSFLLGGITLCSSYLYPQAAAAVGVFSLGVKASAYLFQRFTNLNASC